MKTRSITGFALMEILVVLGITFIALGGIMSLTTYTNGVSLNAIQQNEATMLHNEIYSLLKDSLSCQGSFTPFAVNDVGGAFSNPTQLLRSDGTVAFQAGGTYGNGKLEIQGFSLGDFTPDDAVTSPNSGKATLRINIRKTGSPIGPKDIVRDVRMGVTRNGGTNLVTNCVSIGGTKDIWTQNADGSIYYNGGNVGIGEDAPPFKFVVRDETAVYNSTAIAEVAGNGEPTFNLTTGSNNGNLSPKISFLRSRGTIQAPANVIPLDDLGNLSASGYFNGQFRAGGWLGMEVDPNSAAVPNNSFIPTRLVFLTADPATTTWRSSFTIANDGYVGIGTTNPTQPLYVATDDPGSNKAIVMEQAANGPNHNPNFTAKRSRGTLAAKTAVLAGDEISEFGSMGYDGTQYLYSADMRAVVDGPVAANSVPARLEFRTQGVVNLPVPPTRMTIDSQGFVGIGLTNPSYKLDVRGGDVNIDAANSLRFGGTSVCSSVGCTAVSDVRLKENIQPLENSLEKILQLQGVEYDYRDKAKFGNKHHIGVIAQETEKIFPEVVVTDNKSGFKAVAYDHLVAPLIEAVKSLYYRIVGIDAKIKALETENAQLKVRADKAEKENAEIMARLEKIEKALIAK